MLEFLIENVVRLSLILVSSKHDSGMTSRLDFHSSTPTHKNRKLSAKKEFSDSASSLLEFLVKNAVEFTLIFIRSERFAKGIKLHECGVNYQEKNLRLRKGTT